MFLNDQPIKTSKEDKLERNSFAKHLASAIFSYNNQDSLVISINGEWGLGKSSIINLITEELKLLNYKNNKIPKVINFNPWNFSDQNQLYEQFFNKLSIELGRQNKSKKLKKAGEKIKKYSKILTPLKYVPIIGDFSGITKDSAESLGNFFISSGDEMEKDLDATKEEINKLLLSINKKFIITIDDIDRLNKNEIRQIFQMVKSLGDFKNTIYILSFDKKIVSQALNEVQAGSGINYLEKIVQVPFEIPPVSQDLLYSYFSESLTKIIHDSLLKFDVSYWSKIFHAGIKYMLKNIRDINRFCNVFQFKYNLLKNEINIIDLIALTSIEVFMPSLYNDIRSNRDLFTGVFTKNTFIVRIGHDTGDNLERIKEFEDKLALVPTDLRPKFKALLEEMFPKFKERHHGDSWLSEWRKDGRIASPENFDTFFILNFPQEKLSNSKIEQIVKDSEDIQKLSTEIEALMEKGLILQFLDRLPDYKDKFKDKVNAENMMKVLCDYGDLFPESEIQQILDSDTPMRVLQNLYAISHQFSEHQDRFDLFRNAIQYANKSLYISLHEIAVQDQQHARYGTETTPVSEDEMSVLPEQLDELEKLALSKIHIWRDNGKLINSHYLVSILVCWGYWEKKEEIHKFVLDNVKSDKQFLEFVEKFLGFSTTWSDKVTKTPKLHNDSIDEYFGKDETEQKIKNLLTSDFEMTQHQKLALETYLKNLEPKKGRRR